MLLLRSAPEATPKLPPRLQVFDVVLVHDDDSPPILWRMARVTELLPGRDSVARGCCLKLASGSMIKRPVQRFAFVKPAAFSHFVGHGSVLQMKKGTFSLQSELPETLSIQRALLFQNQDKIPLQGSLRIPVPRQSSPVQVLLEVLLQGSPTRVPPDLGRPSSRNAGKGNAGLTARA
ncbi:hypothetical protein HPB49_002786 [Dermacentor silvarum]|uniref:Uncharacterized protein n=1 Tax=Dermacentor silvarum TaxID=543639 RepID=A0ACB8CP51_DERSI|nr:hypothetical protein HPB49_002786 [Dermacentor silvarum]